MTNAASSLSRASGLVKRVRIPREFVPLSALMAGLVHFLISLLMLFALMGIHAGQNLAANTVPASRDLLPAGISDRSEPADRQPQCLVP